MNKKQVLLEELKDRIICGDYIPIIENKLTMEELSKYHRRIIENNNQHLKDDDWFYDKL